VLAAEELASTGLPEARAIPLGGRGQAPAAYLLRRAGKTVLLSGRIPVKMNQPTAEALMRDVAGSGRRVAQYLASLGRLQQIKPDLWLPALPVNGQNANLYDDDWPKVLAQNRAAFEEPLR
jgi:hypothetical protein